MIVVFALVALSRADNVINNVPYTISTPGQYRVGKTLTAENAQIAIRTTGVTLDLDGNGIIGSFNGVILNITGSEITVKNGYLINNVAGCIIMSGTNITLEHISATAAGQCALFDQNGINNRITHCVFAGGIATFKQPVWANGSVANAVFMVGSTDLFENNIVVSRLTSQAAIVCLNFSGYNQGACAIRNNVVRMPFTATPATTYISLSEFDTHSRNVFPGLPTGATPISGGIHGTD